MIKKNVIAKKRAIVPGQFVRGEKGFMLIVVLVFLVLGAIMITPLLGYMMTGLRATRVYQNNTLELYAAEAGVRDAMWKIQTMDDSDGEVPSKPTDPDLQYNPANVNGLPVTVSITRVDTATFRVMSLGGAPSNGTTIECYVNVLDFTDLLGNAVSSREGVTIQPNSTVNGDVQAPVIDERGTINGNTSNDPVTNWPTASIFATFYGKQVDMSSPYSGDEMVLDLETGPLYTKKDLEISGSGTLTGTIYITGDLTFDKDTYMDLGGQTIYVEGNVTFPTNGIDLVGSGCIIAVGDIRFMPNMNREGDFVFVMSVEQGVNFQPVGKEKGNTFYGSVAGNQNVDLLPNSSLTHREPPDLNLPGQSANIITGVETWKVTPPMNLSLYVATGSTLPSGTVGEPYSGALAASGGRSPYTWLVTAGTVPDGLTLSPEGLISGTPLAADTYDFTVRVTDSASPVPTTATAEISITIDPGLTIMITNASLPDGFVGEYYSQSLAAANGVVPYYWGLFPGHNLPDGLSLDENTGRISGLPTTVDTFSFSILVTDSASPTPATSWKAFSITVIPELSITTASLAKGWTGLAYSEDLMAGGGLPPYTWTRVGSLPDGLTLSPEGLISGTPTATGTNSFVVRVDDSAGHSADPRALSITIGTPPTVRTDPATGIVKVTGKYTVTLNGSLLTVGDAGGAIILWFEWGTDTTYSGGSVGAVPGTSSVPTSYYDTISGLTKDTTYHYRAYVVASDGAVVYGADRTFTTGK